MKECLVEIAHPIAVIYWEAVRIHQWPGNWKKEKHVIMDKVPVPRGSGRWGLGGLKPPLWTENISKKPLQMVIRNP